MKEPDPTAEIAAARAASGEWSRRVEAEYRSAALTSQLAHWIIQVGLSHDLVRLALEVTSDELTHAELSAEVVRAAVRITNSDPAVASPRVDRTSLTYTREWEPLELDVTAACLETFCLGETVAVPLFRRLREHAAIAPARVALDRILADEVKHRDFGWLLFEALLSAREGALCRDFATTMLPSMVARLAASYGSLSDERDMPATHRAWGLMPGHEYALALGDAARREYRPRLKALGFDPQTLACLDALEALVATP
jgi:hypothetical protein